jgi:hypothetical protein
MGLVFGHSGDVGDIIYALPTVRAMGGGEIRLRSRAGVREAMTASKASSISTLLDCQEYITGCFQGESRSETIDLDRFRDHHCDHTNLAADHGRAFGIAPDLAVPWLAVRRSRRVAPVVINRTPRYRQPQFPWEELYRYYGVIAVFVGRREEHYAFEREVGPLPRVETATLLDLAEVIAGAELFMGNQSAAFAIAEGLKVSVIQETSDQFPNCIFPRANAQHIRRREDLRLRPLDLRGWY